MSAFIEETLKFFGLLKLEIKFYYRLNSATFYAHSFLIKNSPQFKSSIKVKLLL